MRGHPPKTRSVDRMLYLGAAGFMLLVFSACAHYSVTDKPLVHWSPELDRAVGKMIAGDRSRELLVLVAFSGGGTRAAAFAYGVLQELAATEVVTGNGSRPLLKEIDVISSVSGGSFTSAYYGLYGDRIFEDFEEQFLRRDVEGALIWKLARPINWFKLASSTYGKSDMAADYYDKILFNGATFAQLLRPDAPALVINSTELATGLRMAFTPLFFDALCMDLNQFPVARAVTASSAVPGLFSTIVLENFAGSCGYEPPAWLTGALKDEGPTSRKLLAQQIMEYLDRKKRPWLHLVDGGVSDNLGLRPFYQLFDLAGNLQNALMTIDHEDVRQILIIAVDSHAKPKNMWAFKRVDPSLLEILGSVSAVEIGHYSIDTIEIVRNAFEKWTEELSAAGHPVTFHFVDVSFAEVQNDQDRNKLFEIGTSFGLNDQEVDLLIASARKVLHNSSIFRDFLAKNKKMMRP